MLSQEFKDNCKKKFMENMLSIKVWVMFITINISTILLVTGFIPATVWCTVLTGVVVPVILAREGIKVSKIKSEDDTKNMFT